MLDMNDLIAGHCMYGAIYYEIEGESLASLICQCTQCQKITGSGNAPQIAFSKDAFKLTGKLHYFEQLADDGNRVSNGFCPSCGNPILKKTTAFPDRVYVHVGSLDDPGIFAPEFVVFTNSGHAWDAVDPNLKRY